MALDIDFIVIDDPAGHGEALLLRGDWVFAVISDGRAEGVGEATHSGDDAACVALMREVFREHVAGAQLTPEGLASLEAGARQAPGAFSRAEGRLEATAISAFDQALWELVARRDDLPVWRLFAERPARPEVRLVRDGSGEVVITNVRSASTAPAPAVGTLSGGFGSGR